MSKSEAPSQFAPERWPITRYLARNIDMDLLLPFVALAALSQNYHSLPFVVRTIIWLLTWLLIEAFLLSIVGYTPIKYFLHIKIRTETGNLLSFQQAFKRTCLVYFYGIGLWIPIFSLLTLCSSFSDLKGKGTTRWDKDLSLIVLQKKPSLWRYMLATFIFIGILALRFDGNYFLLHGKHLYL